MKGFVAVLGGTFDPVHFGHLHVVSCVRAVFEPDAVLLVPCSTPPHKWGRHVTAAHHRLAMLRLALSEAPGAEVSTLELVRGGVSFTIETLRALRDGPQRLVPAFVVGADALAEIDTWRENEALVEEFDLIAVLRPGARTEIPEPGRSRIVDLPFSAGAGVRQAAPPVGAGGRVFRVAIPPSDISSSEVRRLAAAGLLTDGLVPRNVADYIRAHRLYQEEESL